MLKARFNSTHLPWFAYSARVSGGDTCFPGLLPLPASPTTVKTWARSQHLGSKNGKLQDLGGSAPVLPLHVQHHLIVCYRRPVHRPRRCDRERAQVWVRERVSREVARLERGVLSVAHSTLQWQCVSIVAAQARARVRHLLKPVRTGYSTTRTGLSK